MKRRTKNCRRLSVESLEDRRQLAVLMVTNTNDSGPNSLRAAMETANLDAAIDSIQFAIPGTGVQTIQLQSELPGVFSPMILDGWSQPGFTSKPLIKLQAATGVTYGLNLFADGSIVRGFIFNGFDNTHLAIWGSDNNKVQGNYFGTNNAATALEGGTTNFDAIFIGENSVGNIIGVDGDGVSDTRERNIIGGGQSGIGLWGTGSSGNRIAGNYIGTNGLNGNLANQFAGVWLDAGANQNFIGSNNDGLGDTLEGNIISRNGTHGVVINGDNTTQSNRISRNLIYDNALMEIDLANNGPDVIDNLDADSGPNLFANRPELTALTVQSTSVVVSGTLSALPSKTYRIELFGSPSIDASGYGGAQRYLGTFNVTTAASGKVNFTRTVAAALDYGWVVSATATDPAGNTSEFSASIWNGLNLTQTFQKSSNPTATKTIYLDFNGHTTTGTLWNTEYAVPVISTPAFSIDASPAFSNAELLRIQSIYERVAEDFRPFEVNVTTQEPPLGDLIKENASDTRWGVRVSVGGASSDWLGSPSGGIAYLNSFNWNSDTPVFVFGVDNNNNDPALLADNISHEVGHSLGLSHDGSSTQAYYPGHGSGATSWNAIMGGGSSARVTQWSRGQYLDANNTQDDLAIITTQNGFGYRVDDYGNSTRFASLLSASGVSILQTGMISTSTDRDFFYFDTSGGAIDLNFTPAQQGPNLDIIARLFNAVGSQIVSNNPTNQLSARITRTLTAGRYYVSVDGVGQGTPLTSASGYTDYGSLGFYAISGIVSGYVFPSVANRTINSLANSSTIANATHAVPMIASGEYAVGESEYVDPYKRSIRKGIGRRL